MSTTDIIICRDGDRVNQKACKRGTWGGVEGCNMLLALLMRVVNLKHLSHYSWHNLAAGLIHSVTLFNLLVS